MKKGQILGLPLVFIFALIVGALVLAFGLKWVFGLVEQAEYIDLVDKITDLENNIATFSHYDEGSAKVYQLDLPDAVEKVCFYDSGQSKNCQQDGLECDEEIQGSLELLFNDAYNVYIFPQGKFDLSRFSIEEFKAEGANPVCVSNKKSVVVTARDDYVGIAYYEP